MGQTRTGPLGIDYHYDLTFINPNCLYLEMSELYISMTSPSITARIYWQHQDR